MPVDDSLSWEGAMFGSLIDSSLFTPPPAHEGSDRGYSWLFQQHVTQADEGCDFDFLRPVTHKPA